MLKGPHLWALSVALLIVGVWLQPSAGMTKTNADIGCEIRAENFRGGVQLLGVALGHSPISGTYRFLVTKSGSSGSSAITQGGAFSVQPGQETMLGEISLDVDEHASYSAVLTLNWRGGTTSCKKQSSLDI